MTSDSFRLQKFISKNTQRSKDLLGWQYFMSTIHKEVKTLEA